MGDNYLLFDLVPYDGVEFEVDDLVFRLADTTPDQVDVERVRSFDAALDFLKADVVVQNVRVKSDLEVDVLVGRQVAYFGHNCKELLAELGVPRELAADVPQVSELHVFRELAVDHDGPEPNGVLHQLELYSVAGPLDVQKLPFLAVLHDLIEELFDEVVESGLRVEDDVDLSLFLWEDGEIFVRVELDEVFLLQVGLLVLAVEADVHSPLRIIDKADSFDGIGAHLLDAVIEVLVFSVLELQLERNSLSP